MGTVILFSLAALLLIALLLALLSIKIVPEYERGVVFRLGRLAGARGPGLFFLIPIVERMVRLDKRAMARQAEADREKRAKIIHAAGEFKASKMLAQATDVITREPVTL